MKLTDITEHSDFIHNLPLITMSQRWDLHRARVNFGKQPLELWMFVPCKLVDGVWVVLKKPNTKRGIGQKTFNKIKEYEKAKDCCFFKDVELMDGWCIHFEDGTLFVNMDKLHLYNIEDLIQYSLELTPTALKHLNP